MSGLIVWCGEEFDGAVLVGTPRLYCDLPVGHEGEHHWPDPTRLGLDLADLERQDPSVRAARESFDDMAWRLTHPDDCANPFRTATPPGHDESPEAGAREESE